MRHLEGEQSLAVDRGAMLPATPRAQGAATPCSRAPTDGPAGLGNVFAWLGRKKYFFSGWKEIKIPTCTQPDQSRSYIVVQ